MYMFETMEESTFPSTSLESYGLQLYNKRNSQRLNGYWIMPKKKMDRKILLAYTKYTVETLYNVFAN